MRRSLLLVVLLAGCGPQGKPFHYAMDDVLRYDAVQVKGTHNSYHVETPGNDVSYWHFSELPLDVQLDRQGVRQIELDLHWIKDDDGVHHHFEVFHVVAADEGTTCRQFQDCLRTIKSWSDRYPGHLPIYIQMEAKEGFDPALADDFIANLDRDMLAVFPRSRIFTPDDLRGSAASLPAAIANGWPTLAQLRGRVLFNFDNRSEMRDAYTRGLTSLDGRLAFVDSDPGDPFGAISIQNDPTPDAANIAADLAAHFLVRTRADSDSVQALANDYSTFDAALASGATFISTDYPAPVAGTDYHIAIPDGTPARCNPVTAPSDCTSLALEDPAFVGSGGAP